MANQLSKTGIQDNNTIFAYQITQSIDALTGVAAYDLTIAGTLNLTGSLVTGSLTGSLLGTASYAVTAAYALNAGGATASVALNISASYDANGGGFTDGQFKVYIGSFTATTAGTYTSSFNSAFTGKTIGTNIFVVASAPKQAENLSGGVFPVNISASKIVFSIEELGGSGAVSYIAYVLQ